MSKPDVSVIVIVYNDAERLPRAVQSVLGQTLHGVEALIVDDCSTDGSFEVAQRLAAAHPGRVRAFQLPENSKGCGEPRNRGIREATGDFVMFLDSDDELEPNACRNMVEAAERTGADLVSGLSTQVYIDTRNQREQPWYRWLYQRNRVLEDVAELPDLFVFDTLSTNKCYRRDFLLRKELTFVRGLLYEDLLFSAQAYLAADRIALIPNQIYRWYMRQNVANRSITNRRDEIRNYSDRIEIHRRIDALLAARGERGVLLRQAKDTKFLKHDLPLYLREFPQHGPEWQHAFAELTRDYIADFPEERYEILNPVNRVGAYLLVKEDWANLMPAIDWLRNPRKTAMPLVEVEDKVYWCPEHLDDPVGRRMLDVTDAGLIRTSLTGVTPRTQLTEWTPTDGAVRIAGRTVNPLGLMAPDAKLSGRIEVKARRKGLQVFSFPVDSLSHQGDHLTWTADLDISRTLRPLGLVDVAWDVWLVLKVGGTTLRSPLSVDKLDLGEGGFAARPRLSTLLADRLEPEVSRPGHLAFKLTAEGPTAKRGRGALFDLMGSKAGAPLKKTAKRVLQARRDLNSGATKVRWYHRAMTKFPVRKGLVVFESHLGKQYSDSPRAIYEELRRRRGQDFHCVWSYEGKTPPKDFPKDAELVERWSWPYLYALARAEFWVDNQGFPLTLRKRPETTYIQTWHGSALKRMGFDLADNRIQTRSGQASYQAALDRFDAFVCRTEHDVRTLIKAYRLPESKALRVGYPRNDALVAAREQELATGRRDRGKVAAELGIDPDRTIVLYAPTFRDKAPELVVDPKAFAERFGENTTLLVRSHYMQRLAVPRALHPKVVDVTDYPDISPLLALADVLVTDYSSVMFDYALLDRPMVFYAYDYEDYAGSARGTYFDLRENAPGPFVETQDGLFDALSDLAAGKDGYADQRRRFVADFGEYDNGTAAAAIVDKFFMGNNRNNSAKGGRA